MTPKGRIKVVYSKGRAYTYWLPPEVWKLQGCKALRVDLAADLESQLAAHVAAWEARREEAGRLRKVRVNGSATTAIEIAVLDAFAHAKKRAASRRLSFLITEDDVRAMLKAQNGRCAVSNVAFDARASLGRKVTRRPFRPSIDRIDGKRGYVPGNCRLVTVIVNAALNEWGDDALFVTARGIVNRLAVGNGKRKTVWKTNRVYLENRQEANS